MILKHINKNRSFVGVLSDKHRSMIGLFALKKGIYWYCGNLIDIYKPFISNLLLCHSPMLHLLYMRRHNQRR